jgi:predicted nuclease of predicted toxin-antitoxin system
MLFIFDVNISQQMARGLALLEQGNRKSARQAEIYHSKDYLPGNATDEEIIQQAQRVGGIVITQDLGFGRIAHEYTILKKYKVGVVYWKPPKTGLSYWDMVTIFINKWEELKRIIEEHENPSAYLLEKTGKIKWLAHTH